MATQEPFAAESRRGPSTEHALFVRDESLARLIEILPLRVAALLERRGFHG